MKKLIFSLIFLLTLLLIGCQENSITDPNQVSAEANKIPDHILTGSIQLKGNLSNPYPVINSFIRIDGEIDYQLKISYSDPVSPVSQQTLSLQFSVNADLTDYCTVCTPPETPAGTITAKSDEVVNISDRDYSSIIDTYEIQDRDDGMVLKLSLLVTSNSVELKSMWLEKIDIKTTSDSQSL